MVPIYISLAIHYLRMIVLQVNAHGLSMQDMEYQ